jgi:pyridoxamine 5'-phosphate oxidase
MTDFKNIVDDKPYVIFKKLYKKALLSNQSNIEAISIASYSKLQKEISSRFVNLKIIDSKKFIFFTNYESDKASDFYEHNQIAVNIFWNNINTQIRIKANILKLEEEYSDIHYASRDPLKNALAISSNQSNIIASHKEILNKYNSVLKYNDLSDRPKYWGGFSFIPYYFEFWEGHESRLNKREVYEKSDDSWKHFFLQP